MKDYQSQIDTLALTDNIDLGVIPLLKIYSLRISCYYEDIEYEIYDENNRVVYAASGSRRLQLVQGRYKISFDIGEGQIKTKKFLLNYNNTISVP